MDWEAGGVPPSPRQFDPSFGEDRMDCLADGVPCPFRPPRPPCPYDPDLGVDRADVWRTGYSVHPVYSAPRAQTTPILREAGGDGFGGRGAPFSPSIRPQPSGERRKGWWAGCPVYSVHTALTLGKTKWTGCWTGYPARSDHPVHSVQTSPTLGKTERMGRCTGYSIHPVHPGQTSPTLVKAAGEVAGGVPRALRPLLPYRPPRPSRPPLPPCTLRPFDPNLKEDGGDRVVNGATCPRRPPRQSRPLRLYGPNTG